MKINIKKMDPLKCKTPVFVIALFKGEKKLSGIAAKLNNLVEGKIEELLKSGEISGKYKEFTFIHTHKSDIKRVLIMGLGEKEKFESDMLRSVMAIAARNVRRIRCKSISILDFSYIGIDSKLASELVIEGMQLGLHKFNKYLGDRRNMYLDEVNYITETDNEEEILKGCNEGMILSDATIFCRDLVNEPANVLHPGSFTEIIKQMAKEKNIEFEVFDKKKLQKMGMNLILAVGNASVNEPKMVILKYRSKKAKKHVGLIGKGVTFDSGGYQVKGGDIMLRMNGDMGGAAAVVAAMQAVAEQKLPVNVTAMIPMVENLINGEGYKPNDIIKSYSGKTVEILHTDAEGRLILADAITYMTEQGVDCMVDIATLTGGCIVSLGHQMSGVFGTDQSIVDKLKNAGETSSELLWQLPIHDDYLPLLSSDVADLSNTGGRAASAIGAAMFLREFTNGIPWAHLDIAGTAVMDKQIFFYYKRPYNPKEGATGVGTRLLYHFLKKF